MSHATVRATNIPEIVKLICENMHMSESEALDAFYSSSTGKSYANDETGLYGQSVLYVYGLFCTEMRNQSRHKYRMCARKLVKINLLICVCQMKM